MKSRQTTLMFNFKEEESKENQRCSAVGKTLKENKIKSKMKLKIPHCLETFGIKRRTGFKDKNQFIFVSVLLRTKTSNAVHELENG